VNNNEYIPNRRDALKVGAGIVAGIAGAKLIERQDGSERPVSDERPTNLEPFVEGEQAQEEMT
jgi:hypothetical protein